MEKDERTDLETGNEEGTSQSTKVVKEEKFCWICNNKIIKRIKLPKRKKKVQDFLTRPFSIVLCKALNVSAATYSKRFLNSPSCSSCVHKIQNIKHIVFALETLQKTIKEFRLQIIESLELSNSEDSEEAILPEVEFGMQSDQAALRKEIIDLLAGWKERYRRSQSKQGSGKVPLKISLDKIKALPQKTILSRVKEMLSSPSEEVIPDEPSRSLCAMTLRPKRNVKRSRFDSDYIIDPLGDDVEYVVKEEIDDDFETLQEEDGSEIIQEVKEEENIEDYREEIDDEDGEDSDIAPASNDGKGKSKRNVKGNRKACLLCKYSFKTQFDLEIHTKKAHLGMKQPFKCAEEGCNRTFRQRYLWKKHFQIHKTGENLLSRFECDICNKKYETRNSLQRHRSSHTGEWKYPCTVCDRGYHRPSDLKVHLAKQHDADRPYPCNLCELKFPSSKNRNVHVAKFHPKEKSDLTCEICSKVFSGKDALRCHTMQIHSNDSALPYICQICGKGFAKNSWLERHSLQHSDVKKYECEYEGCDMKFRFPNSLACHKLKHENSFPHQCTVVENGKACGKGFRLRTQCNTHMLTHNKNKGQICEYCGKTFAVPIYLTNHLKRIHFEELGLGHRPKYFSRDSKRDNERRKSKRRKASRVEENIEEVEVTFELQEGHDVEEQIMEQDDADLDDSKGEKVEVLYEEQIETLQEVVVDNVQVLQLGTLIEKDGENEQYIQVYVSNQ